MSHASRKGYNGEVEAAEFFNSLVKPEFHICRIGGIEAKKHVFSGDVSVVQMCTQHSFVSKKDWYECPLSHVFFEVKNQKSPSIWTDMKKAKDDAYIAGKQGVIGYFIKAEGTGYNTERLIVMTPDTFKKIWNLQKQ